MKLKLDKNKKYLLGCSYGPDSMALFYLLEENGIDFDVAIVNYHLRTESDDEVNGLKEYCEQHHKVINVLDVNDVPRRNIEENCRKIRYEFFAELIRQNGYEGVIVAHHQDDLLETYLMQKTRQNCPVFYGMKAKTHIFGIDVYRPLLDLAKKDLHKICEENKVPFMIDKSNQNTVFLRNKIRHETVSKMSKSDREKMLKEIEDENTKLNELLAKIDLSKLHKKDYLLSLDERSFLYAINMLKNQAGNFEDIGKRQCNEIKKILKSPKPNVIANVSSKLVFKKEYEEVCFSENEKVESFSYIVNAPCEMDTPYFKLDFRKDTSNRNISLEDYPLTIRNIRLDDQYQIKNYVTTGRRLLIDWKVPLTLRKKWPVILSKDGKIKYIPHYQKDFKRTDDLNFFVKIK